MRSYPNIIPLSAPAVARIGAMLEPYAFDVIYGAFFDRVIPRGGKEALRRSVARYIAADQRVTEGRSSVDHPPIARRRRCGTGSIDPPMSPTDPAARVRRRLVPRRLLRGVAVGASPMS